MSFVVVNGLPSRLCEEADPGSAPRAPSLRLSEVKIDRIRSTVSVEGLKVISPTML
jgi:hypothetical protein